MPINGGMELLLGFRFLFRSWGKSVYATMCLRKKILGVFSSIIAVVRTDEADTGEKQNCVFFNMTDCGCDHIAFTAIMMAFSYR